MNEDLRKRFRFFHENAGGIVGQSAIGAIELARAELRLEEMQDNGEDVAAWWEDDPEPYDVGTVVTEDEARALFESNAWTGPYGCIVRVGETYASLWGIVLGPRGTDDPYARVVMAELASEALDGADREAAERARAANEDTATIYA